MKNGVPFDVAFALEEHELIAYGVIFGEIDGGEWSWDTLTWKSKD